MAALSPARLYYFSLAGLCRIAISCCKTGSAWSSPRGDTRSWQGPYIISLGFTQTFVHTMLTILPLLAGRMGPWTINPADILITNVDSCQSLESMCRSCITAYIVCRHHQPLVHFPYTCNHANVHLVRKLWIECMVPFPSRVPVHGCPPVPCPSSVLPGSPLPHFPSAFPCPCPDHEHAHI